MRIPIITIMVLSTGRAGLVVGVACRTGQRALLYGRTVWASANDPERREGERWHGLL